MWRKREIRPSAGGPRPGPASEKGPDAPDPAQGTVAEWRRRRLARVGFEPALAAPIAANCAYDLHELIGLVERGCPPALAVRILAPDDPREEPC